MNLPRSTLRKAATGRADLLDCLRLLKKEGLQASAHLFGYEPLPGKLEENSSGAKNTAGADTASTTTAALGLDAILVAGPRPGAHFWRVNEDWIFGDDLVGSGSKWLDGPILNPEEYGVDHTLRLPKRHTLRSWPRLWPFLRSAIGENGRGSVPDWRLVVEIIARQGFLPRRLPYLPRRRWVGNCQLLLDYNPQRMIPFRQDVDTLVHDIVRLRGKNGLTICCFEDDPGHWYRPRSKHDALRAYTLPQPDAAVLAVTDLGCFDQSGKAQSAWLRLGLRLRRAGIIPSALMPCPPRLWDERLAKVWRLACWDRGGRLPRLDDGRARGGQPRVNKVHSKGAEKLLALLSPVPFVESDLLRAMRLLLPMDEADVGSEAEAWWRHGDTHSGLLGFSFTTEAIVSYREAFKQVPYKLRQRAAALIRVHHAHFPDPVRRVLDNILRNLMPEETSDPANEAFLCDAARTLYRTGHEGMAYWASRISRLQHPDLWRKSEGLAVLWALVHRHEWQDGRITLPVGLDLNKVASILEPEVQPRQWHVRQVGMALHLDTRKVEGPGSPVGELASDRQMLAVSRGEGEADKVFRLSGLHAGLQLRLPDKGTLLLKTDRQQLRLEMMPKPVWADAMGRDQHGLFADVSIKSVSQRFRWIRPGSFLMGSPLNEPERWEDEVQHEVTLTKGFWLADTACTQAVWREVMGENPSDFKGEQLPVENVSWEDCQRFILRINSWESGLDLRLPTEAEWEYACRAGTTTPFSFGASITPEEVNYDGNYPYAGGKKGLYRKKTVEVGSLPCNTWGLYEMHGNVWEWCSDLKAKYPTGVEVDPEGPSEGVSRVLRGGGWVRDGGRCRSACRLANHPANRFWHYGFRLARGQ